MEVSLGTEQKVPRGIQHHFESNRGEFFKHEEEPFRLSLDRLILSDALAMF